MAHLWVCAVVLVQGGDKGQANSYDDAWEAAWVNHCRSVLSGGTGKTAGFVLQIGDSITHANPYSQWPRSGGGATTEDATLLAWIHAADGFPISNNSDTSIKNGFYLAVADTSSVRGMTAAGGLDTAEALSGDGNGGTPMPTQSDPATARGIVANGTTYTGNLNLSTVAAAFEDAQFAVTMLGTNDIDGGRSVNAALSDLATLVGLLEARHTVVILSTIPPHYDANRNANVVSFNAGVRNLAMTRGLPLIDFYAEILARRPGTSWNGTLLAANDVHPSSSGGGYDSSSNPYADGGNPATHATGAACLNVGYLLRSWLTVQKLKEVRTYVVNGVDPPTNDDSGGGHHCGGPVDASGTGRSGMGILTAILILAFGLRRAVRLLGRPAS